MEIVVAAQAEPAATPSTLRALARWIREGLPHHCPECSAKLEGPVKSCAHCKTGIVWFWRIGMVRVPCPGCREPLETGRPSSCDACGLALEWTTNGSIRFEPPVGAPTREASLTRVEIADANGATREVAVPFAA